MDSLPWPGVEGTLSGRQRAEGGRGVSTVSDAPDVRDGGAPMVNWNQLAVKR